MKLIPYRQEHPHTCLPACIRIVLDYQGWEHTEAELATLEVSSSVLITGGIHLHLDAASIPTQPAFKRYRRMLAVIAAPVVGETVEHPPPTPCPTISPSPSSTSSTKAAALPAPAFSSRRAWPSPVRM